MCQTFKEGKALKKTLIWILVLTFVCPLTAGALTTMSPEKFAASLSWFGNTYSGKAGMNVQHDVADIFVTPEGELFTNVFWDEHGQNYGHYDKNGNLLRVGGNSHGWGYEGGYAVAANSEYVYFGQNIDNEGDHLLNEKYDGSSDRWPPAGLHWYGVSRRLRSDISKGAPFEGGLGGSEGSVTEDCFLLVTTASNVDYNRMERAVTGLYATEDTLYVSDDFNDYIRVYDAQTMVHITDIPFENPGQLTMDKSGTLWVLQKSESRAVPITEAYETDLARVIDLSEAVPTDIAVDSRGRLMVSDASVHEQIILFGNLDTAPEVVGYRGVDGGVFSGTPGLIGNGRFNQVGSIGADNDGNYYVTNTGTYVLIEDSAGSTVIESYTEEDRLRYRVYGPMFMDNAAPDPENKDEVYTRHEKFVFDRSRPEGRQAAYTAYTLNPHKYPEDPRLAIGSLSPIAVRWISGQKFLFMTDYYGYNLLVYRFNEETDGEVAIPCGLFSSKNNLRGDYPPNLDRTKPNAFVWVDHDGDARFDANEYTYAPEDNRIHYFGYGWTFAPDGTVFSGGTHHDGYIDQRILTFPLQEITENGVPVWGFDDYSIESISELESIRRAQYDSDEDVMYFSGFQSLGDVGERDRDAGDTFIRVDNWSTPNERAVAYTAPLDRETITVQERFTSAPLGFSLAGDYLFTIDATFCYGAKIYIYDKSTGALADTIRYDEDYGAIGYMDIPNAITASYLGDGKYDLFLEDDGASKILHYSWEEIPFDASNRMLAVNADVISGGEAVYNDYAYPQFAPSAIAGLEAGDSILYRGISLLDADYFTISAVYPGSVGVYLINEEGEEKAATLTLDGAGGDYRTVSAALPKAYTGIYDVLVKVESGTPNISWVRFPKGQSPSERFNATKLDSVGGNWGYRDDGPEGHPDNVGWVNYNTFLKYDAFVFHEPVAVQICMKEKQGGIAEIGMVLDSRENEPFVTLKGTSDQGVYEVVTVPLTGLSEPLVGKHDIIIQASTEEASIAWFRFIPHAIDASPIDMSEASLGKASVEITKLFETDETAMLVLACYDEQGRLRDFNADYFDTATLVGETDTLVAELEEGRLPQGYLKAFVWKDQTTMEPLCTAVYD